MQRGKATADFNKRMVVAPQVGNEAQPGLAALKRNMGWLLHFLVGRVQQRKGLRINGFMRNVAVLHMVVKKPDFNAKTQGKPTS